MRLNLARGNIAVVNYWGSAMAFEIPYRMRRLEFVVDCWRTDIWIFNCNLYALFHARCSNSELPAIVLTKQYKSSTV